MNTKQSVAQLAVPHRKRIHGPALGKAHGLARGVLEIGDAVEKARLFRRGKHGLPARPGLPRLPSMGTPASFAP